MRQAIILAGGKGARLRTRLGDLPKPMIPIGGKPLLEHHIELARQYGFTDLLLLTGYRADAISDHFGDGRRWGVSLRYSVEAQPLSTAGAALQVWPLLADRFIVLYGDVLANVDLSRLWQAHERSRADASLLLHPNDHPLDSDLVEVGDGGWITRFHNRPHPQDRDFQNLVNAGLYVIEKATLAPWAAQPRFLDFGKDIFPALLSQNRRLLGYRSPEYIKDIGTPERYDRVCAEYASGVVRRGALSTPQPAVFLDRDGTLNREVDGVTSPEALELLPGVAQAVRELNHHGIRAVVITNQPIIAKGFCTEADVEAVHRRLEMLLGREHAFLDRIYYCPHHPEKGFPGERPALKIECGCRKPSPGMVRQAAIDLGLDLSRSWIIGDSTADVATAANAGVRSILLRTGHGGRDAKYDVALDRVFDTLKDAVDFIVGESPISF